MNKAILLMGMAAILGACSQKNGGNSAADIRDAETSDSIAVKLYSLKDSIEVDSCMARIDLNVQFPSGKSKVESSIDQWISARMNANSLWNRQPDVILKAVADSLETTSRNDFESFAEDLWSTNYEFQWTCSKIADTPGYVTYSSNFYQYTGGAHGGVAFAATTFDKSSGRPLGWDMFRSDALGKLTQMVKNTIMTDYFEATPADFQDYLLVEADPFPLPAMAPYFMPDGLHFCYQQYEISCYASGMPGCVLPYKEVAPLLTDDSRRLIER